ncbi:MAG TPA: cation diffusion facilitator family transporter [Flavobacteriaceae bacterium]|nr:cation diffusion facilitator family transporter [Flavobacteriaceae bacterium]
MAAGGSNLAIYGAIGANILIATAKFIGAAITGSSAMMAEGIHSLVDTGNGFLLLLGIKRSKRKPDKLHPFGYGKEVYFWSFVVSMLIFAVGGGFAIYEGIHALQAPSIAEDPTINYVVLTAAVAFEGTALFIALRTFNKARTGSKNIFKNIIKSKDAATFAVIIEDSAALLGLLIALIGTFLSQQLQNPYMDGCASILIGVVLLLVAIFLARESKGLLLGESADDVILTGIDEILRNNEKVQTWNLPQTMHFGPDNILLTMEIDLIDEMDHTEAEKILVKLRADIQEKYPKVNQIYFHVKEISNEPENKL